MITLNHYDDHNYMMSVGVVMYGHTMYCWCQSYPDIQSGQPQTMGLVGQDDHIYFLMLLIC